MEDIKNHTALTLSSFLEKEGYPSFSARQILAWIYQKRIDNFSRMSNISKDERLFLKNNFYSSYLIAKKHLVSRDGTEKFLFTLTDGQYIESVIIPEARRITLCLSTQVGCKFRCSFCASGAGGFVRNLSTAEIINQYLAAADAVKPKKITNLVFMGIGEPLDNFDNLMKSLEILSASWGAHYNKRKITVSTCGFLPGIKRLTVVFPGVRLSLSLHSADAQKRSRLMPVNNKYPLGEVMSAMRDYASHQRLGITFEYILIKGFNSSPEDAAKLAKLLRGMRHKVNIIPYNPSFGFSLQTPSSHEITAFGVALKRYGVFFTIRRARGQDIGAACGQLRSKQDDNENICV